MIISASRRTDIPAYYAEWFFNRLKEGYVLVRNPMNAHQIGKIPLTSEAVDGIVFWTKNPTPMLDKLVLLQDYTYYFQFTVNAYGQDIEAGVPSKKDLIIPCFQKLSTFIGKERVIWRYDPILLNKKYTVQYHIYYFEKLAKLLAPYTEKCTISFLDFYKSVSKRLISIGAEEIMPEEQLYLAGKLAEIAHAYDLTIDTCAESIDLSQYKIEHGRCIDDRLFRKLLNCSVKFTKDKNQRLECGCMESIDIGAYNTCLHGCKYCYANHNSAMVRVNSSQHNHQSPLLTGVLSENDKITVRKQNSCIIRQMQLQYK